MHHHHHHSNSTAGDNNASSSALQQQQQQQHSLDAIACADRACDANLRILVAQLDLFKATAECARQEANYDLATFHSRFIPPAYFLAHMPAPLPPLQHPVPLHLHHAHPSSGAAAATSANNEAPRAAKNTSRPPLHPTSTTTAAAAAATYNGSG